MANPRKKKKDDGEQKTIECKVLQELYTDEFKGRVEKVRVVVWIINGAETGGSKFERREFHVKEADGSQKMGKAKGLNKKDLLYIVENWGELSMFFD